MGANGYLFGNDIEDHSGNSRETNDFNWPSFRRPFRWHLQACLPEGVNKKAKKDEILSTKRLASSAELLVSETSCKMMQKNVNKNVNKNVKKCEKICVSEFPWQTRP